MAGKTAEQWKRRLQLASFDGNLPKWWWGMDMEKTKAISYYHAATFSDSELLWIFGKDYS